MDFPDLVIDKKCLKFYKKSEMVLSIKAFKYSLTTIVNRL